MKTYKTYQARNAVKAALVTNHIIAQKKLGVTHSEAKAEAYRLYNIKAGLPILRKHFSRSENKSPVIKLPPLPTVKINLPPLPKTSEKQLQRFARRFDARKAVKDSNLPFPPLPPLPKVGA